jgi:hypothetical protein
MKKNKEPTHWLWKYVAAILLFAAAVNGAMYLPIPTLSTLTSSDWLGFWGGYLGGAIGCIPAIAALLHSQAESKRLHEETAEAQRCSVLPVFSVFVDRNLAAKSPDEYDMFIALSPDGKIARIPNACNSDYYDFLEEFDADEWVRCNLSLKNIGLGPALNPLLTFTLGEMKNRSIASFHSLSTAQNILILLSTPAQVSLQCKIEYSDIFGNKYSQSFSIDCSNSVYKHYYSFSRETPPELCTLD